MFIKDTAGAVPGTGIGIGAFVGSAGPAPGNGSPGSSGEGIVGPPST
ncbi:hypothetical protein OkiPb00532_46500 [Escherichia coli]